ncbi:hypothetical protein [Haloplanus sp. C73]|uniref:hypothetical protein n=1 Tax=Haloplanus sp. C73 TaxID=3421641 RepID=UPI003EC017F3
MQRSSLVIAVIVVAAIGALGASLVLDVGNAGQGDAESGVESFPTATEPTASPNDSDGAATNDTGPEFGFTIDQIESCGETCRDVTTTLNNDGGGATNVTVYTRIHAGNGTDGQVVWEGTEPVGDLAADDSYTTTERVELSVTEAFAVQQADGWITVRMAVESDQRTTTFTERRNVL